VTKNAYRDWDRLLKIPTRELFDILIRICEGRFDVSIEHRRLEKVVKWLVHGIFSAALFMGDSMILSQGISPKVGGISIVGAVTSFLELLLGYRLVRAMHKSGNL
jgi:ubiquinone biosynthesis protein